MYLSISIYIRRFLLIFCGVIFSVSVFASCEVRVSSLVDIKNGSSSIVGYDDLSDSIKTWAIPVNALTSNSVTFPFYGKHIDCSTANYKNHPLFSFSLTPFCNKNINSSLLSELKDGEYYTQKCSSGLSIDALKTNDDSVFRISIVPTGFHAITVNNLIPNKSESRSVALKATNVNASEVADTGASQTIFKNGVYYFHNVGIQRLLYDVAKADKSHLDLFVLENNQKIRMGECSFSINKNRPDIKCQTISNPSNYKVVVQYDTIYLIDPSNSY